MDDDISVVYLNTNYFLLFWRFAIKRSHARFEHFLISTLFDFFLRLKVTVFLNLSKNFLSHPKNGQGC
jgi:hypothetical protein